MNPSAHTKASLVLFLILAASHACLAQAPGAAPCKSKPERRQFDFWVGEWDVQNPQGHPAGTSSVRLILGDCVVFENWTGAKGGEGKSFNVYRAATGKWQQTWVDNSGSLLELRGDYKDNQMRLEGVTTGGDGKQQLERLTFTKISADRVRQLWEQSTDGGKTWKIAFDGMYIRKK